MAFVKQRNKKDCGVASLAMLCNVEYEAAERAIPWRREGILHGTSTKQLVDGAAKLGYETRGTETGQLKRLMGKTWGDIPDNSLVKVPHPNPKIGMWHWVVWRKDKVYDPARGVFKPEKYDLVPSSYMQFVPEHECSDCGAAMDGPDPLTDCPCCS